MLQLYRRLLALRRSQAALHEGSCVPLGVQGNVLLYARGDGAHRMVVLLNFGATFASVDMGAQSRIPLPLPLPLRVWLSTALDRDESVDATITLRPEEGLILGTWA
jgi:alpha-glucosidase